MKRSGGARLGGSRTCWSSLERQLATDCSDGVDCLDPSPTGSPPVMRPNSLAAGLPQSVCIFYVNWMGRPGLGLLENAECPKQQLSKQRAYLSRGCRIRPKPKQTETVGQFAFAARVYMIFPERSFSGAKAQIATSAPIPALLVNSTRQAAEPPSPSTAGIVSCEPPQPNLISLSNA